MIRRPFIGARGGRLAIDGLTKCPRGLPEGEVVIPF